MAPVQKKPDKKTSSGGAKTVQMRILGFVITPVESILPTKRVNYTNVCDFEMGVKPETTIREIKAFTLARLPSLHYYEMDFEFWNKILKDAVTIKEIHEEFKIFQRVNCLHLHITVVDDMFKAMYKTFSDIGMPEEKALEQTKGFMETYQNKDVDYEYDLAMKVQSCRITLEKQGLKLINDSKYPMPTRCD